MACIAILALGLATVAVAFSTSRTASVLPAAATAAVLDPAPRTAALPVATAEPPDRAVIERGGAEQAREPQRSERDGVPLNDEATTGAEVEAQLASAIEDPASLVADSIGVESDLQQLGLNADGSLEVPAVGPLYDQAGWFTGSPRPGEVGPAVLLGHVDGLSGTPSVFYRLAELRAGDRVAVGRGDGSEAYFEVYLVEQYPKDSFPSERVYGDTAGPELRLITCAGSWDPGTGHYRDNTVVYAQLVGQA